MLMNNDDDHGDLTTWEDLTNGSESKGFVLAAMCSSHVVKSW